MTIDNPTNAPAPPPAVEPASLVGKHFIQFLALDPTTNRREIRLGVVLSRIDEQRWLFEFQSPLTDTVTREVSADQLGDFTFFASREERQLFFDRNGLARHGRTYSLRS